MEREIQKENGDMFDFRKSDAVVNEQMKKVELAGYKKLALVSMAFAAFLSVGLTAGNLVVSKYNSGLELEKTKTVLQFQQEQKNKEAQQQQIDNTKNLVTINQQQHIDFLSNKIKAIDKPTFNKLIAYLEGHEEFYDARLKTIRKSLFDAQTADKLHAVDPNTTSKELEVAVVNYKKDLEDVITKTSLVYSSVKDNHAKEDNVSVNDMTTFLKIYDQFNNGLVIHNKPIELKIKEILYLKNKANVDYNVSHDMFNNDEKMTQEAEKEIKKLKP